MKTYITFGQVHTHFIAGITFDKDCVAVVECDSAKDGREKAFKFFGDKFHNASLEDDFDIDDLKYYPRGFVEIPLDAVPPPEKKMEVIYFSNGNTAVFDKNGNQIPELQQGWLKLSVEFIKSKGLDPLKMKFTLPNNDNATLFKTEDGYNWRIE